jgi:hypothetical protein
MALEKPAHFVFRGAERQIPYIDRRHSNSHSASGAGSASLELAIWNRSF